MGVITALVVIANVVIIIDAAIEIGVDYAAYFLG